MLAPLISAAGLVAAAAAGELEWPQWRGPHLDGRSRETNWQNEGSTLWRASVGLGYSSVVVLDGRVYTLGFDEGRDEDSIYCLDAETGKEHWSYSYPARIMAEAHGGGTLTTPAVEGEVVYCSNRAGTLLCLSSESGEKIWSRSFQKDFGLKQPRWGFAASPLVMRDKVVMNAGKVLAFHKATGELLWETEKNYGDAYATAVGFEHGGDKLFAIFAGSGLAVIRQQDGSGVALYEWETSYDVNAATPVVSGNQIFVSSGYNHGCAMLEFDGSTLKPVWESKVMRNHMEGCLLIDGYLYGFDEKRGLKCVNWDGEEQWGVNALGKGALGAAGERLIVLSGGGELIIAEVNPDKYQPLSRKALFDGGRCWTAPVLVDGLIYCRNSRGELVCQDHRSPAGR